MRGEEEEEKGQKLKYDVVGKWGMSERMEKIRGEEKIRRKKKKEKERLRVVKRGRERRGRERGERRGNGEERKASGGRNNTIYEEFLDAFKQKLRTSGSLWTGSEKT